MLLYQQMAAPAWGMEGDYCLVEGSPAINASLTQGAPTDDLEGRPCDAQPGLGVLRESGGDIERPPEVSETSEVWGLPQRAGWGGSLPRSVDARLLS